MSRLEVVTCRELFLNLVGKLYGIVDDVFTISIDGWVCMSINGDMCLVGDGLLLLGQTDNILFDALQGNLLHAGGLNHVDGYEVGILHHI